MDALKDLFFDFLIPTLIVAAIFLLFVRKSIPKVAFAGIIIGGIALLIALGKALVASGFAGAFQGIGWVAIISFLIVVNLAVFFPLPPKACTVFKRELASYFTSPIAYVLFVVFLGISNGLSFFFTGVLESNEADLFLPYFQYIPWYLVLVAPAIGMRLWSEEQRLGTMELILTMPLAPWHAIVGKYLAAAIVLFIMLVLSFPIVWTINYLGNPDNGVVLSGFVASYLVALCFLAVTSVISAITRSQLVALLISVAICLLIWLSGLPQVSELIMSVKGGWTVFLPLLKLINGLGVMPHFTELAKGILSLRDVAFFLIFIAFCLFATSVAIRLKRA